MNEELLRELVPAVIGILVRRGADFASAEDAVQEALIRALDAWREDPPRDPKAWLIAAGGGGGGPAPPGGVSGAGGGGRGRGPGPAGGA
ncbi:sigma factor, partial [Amycolatopsis sp. NPDC059090]|uniref:sigma factor n=1 Tax=Amycolatopsis sp. NPDC059090 TaxID=3346723 RepID=UPI00366C1FD4